MSLPAWDGRAWREAHDPRLVAQCEPMAATHPGSCRCDACCIVRGQPTHRVRVYVEAAGLDGHPDSDDPTRRTLAGRVVRWARAWRSTRKSGWWVVIVRPAVNVRVVRGGTKGAAESRALAGTA